MRYLEIKFELPWRRGLKLQLVLEQTSDDSLTEEEDLDSSSGTLTPAVGSGLAREIRHPESLESTTSSSPSSMEEVSRESATSHLQDHLFDLPPEVIPVSAIAVIEAYDPTRGVKRLFTRGDCETPAWIHEGMIRQGLRVIEEVLEAGLMAPDGEEEDDEPG